MEGNETLLLDLAGQLGHKIERQHVGPTGRKDRS